LDENPEITLTQFKRSAFLVLVYKIDNALTNNRAKVGFFFYISVLRIVALPQPLQRMLLPVSLKL
jgi:hypothetical protein